MGFRADFKSVPQVLSDPDRHHKVIKKYWRTAFFKLFSGNIEILGMDRANGADLADHLGGLTGVV